METGACGENPANGGEPPLCETWTYTVSAAEIKVHDKSPEQASRTAIASAPTLRSWARMLTPTGPSAYEESGVEAAIASSNVARVSGWRASSPLSVASLSDSLSLASPSDVGFSKWSPGPPMRSPGFPRRLSPTIQESSPLQASQTSLLDGEPGAEKTTLVETMVNTSLALVGSGVLGIPYAFGQSGFLCGVVLALVTILTMWTAVLIGRLMDATKPLAQTMGIEQSAHDWPFLGYVAFGKVGRAVVSFCQLGELWGCMLGFLVVNGVNLHLIFPNLGQELCIVICGFVSFLLLFPSAKTLAYFSSVGIAATVFAVGSLAWSAESMPVWESNLEAWKWLDTPSIPLALGIIQFCFVAHGALPTMHREMRSPSKEYSLAMFGAFTFAGAFYLTVGLFAFCVYGSVAQVNFMQNLGRDLDLELLPGKAFLYIVATALFAINIQASFPLFALGLIAASEMHLGIAQRGMFIRTIWKMALLSLTTFLAVILKDCMAPILSLIGCFCATCTCLLFPMTFTLKLMKTRFPTKIVIGLSLIYSLYILTFGTYTNVVKIVHMIAGR